MSFPDIMRGITVLIGSTIKLIVMMSYNVGFRMNAGIGQQKKLLQKLHLIRKI